MRGGTIKNCEIKENLSVSVKRVFGILACLALFLSLCGVSLARDYKGKKILYVDSYHEGYAWSDGITNGIKAGLDGTGVELKVFRMDTKRNADEGFKKEAALKAKTMIEAFAPDVVIASDDNASKYLIMPISRTPAWPSCFAASTGMDRYMVIPIKT